MSDRLRRKAAILLMPALAVAVIGCSSGGAGTSTGPSSAPSNGPDASPSATPDVATLDHPTGAADVVLRYDEGGGFMMPAFSVTMVPHFTLYGDGTIVYRDPSKEWPPMEGSMAKFNPLRTAKLSEPQIQELLLRALSEGGLAVARPDYPNDMIADASTATFTIDAGGVKKAVSVYALGLDVEGLADGPARAAFADLAKSLTTIEDGGVIKATDYAPSAYRGVLFDANGMVEPGARAWPWDDIDPSDFVADADPNGFAFPHRIMTPDEVEALGITGYEGGLQNVPLTGPDGVPYALSIRPLLPDDAS